MIIMKKWLSIPVDNTREEIPFHELRGIQERFIRGEETGEDKKLIEAIISAVLTGELE
jgi:hypothetical protein